MARRSAPVLDYTVYWTADGRPYWRNRDGQPHFIPPITAGQYRDDPRMVEFARRNGVTDENPSGNVPGNSFLRGRGQWDTAEGGYDRPINWGNLLSVGVGGAMAAPFVAPLLGVGGASGAAGGGGSAGLIPSSTIPLASGTYATVPAVASQAASAAIPLTASIPASTIPLANETFASVPQVASQGVSQEVPLGGMRTPEMGGTGGDNGGMSIADRIRRALTSPEAITSLASLVPTLMAMNRQNGPSAMDEQTARMAKLNEARFRRADPLHQAAVRLAFGRMPVNSRGGLTTPPDVPLPE